MDDSDVLIIGGGIVGSTLALLLGDAGWRVTIVDAAPAPEVDETLGRGKPALRVSALTAASQRLLTSLDVWPWLAARRVAAYRGMQVWDAEGSGEIGFDADDVGVDALGHIVENELLLAALAQRLQALPSVEWLSDVRLTGYVRDAGQAVITLDNGEQRRAPLIVGADGANSPLRGMAGIPVRERDTGQAAMVTTVRTGVGHGGVGVLEGLADEVLVDFRQCVATVAAHHLLGVEVGAVVALTVLPLLITNQVGAEAFERDTDNAVVECGVMGNTQMALAVQLEELLQGIRFGNALIQGPFGGDAVDFGDLVGDRPAVGLDDYIDCSYFFAGFGVGEDASELHQVRLMLGVRGRFPVWKAGGFCIKEKNGGHVILQRKGAFRPQGVGWV